jgi:glutathione synthase/RimK-type ligase-like ATP-grasp enzyme
MPSDQPRVALVTCDEFPNLFDDDRPLVPTFAKIGVRATPTVWSDRSVEWAGFDALVIRSPWDYYRRPVEFRAWLDARADAGSLLCNSAEVLRWNYDKRYLSELATAGVASIVPTSYVGRGEKPDLAALAWARGWDEIVIKPSISAGAYRTHRFRAGDAAAHAAEIDQILSECGLLVQPFLPEIVRDGELSLLFFDGVFSHAVRKRAKAGDYRVQFRYGGTDALVEVEAALVEQARACVLAAPSLPTYARVDGLIKDGGFLLMELELFEPLLFLSHHPEAAHRFASAVKARLEGAGALE